MSRLEGGRFVHSVAEVDAEDPARHRDGEPVGGKPMNEPEPYWEDVLRAK